jgi:hypothetical protein
MKDSIQEAYIAIVAQELEEGKLKDAALAIGAAATIAGGAMMANHEPAPTHKVVTGKIDDLRASFAKTAKFDPDFLASSIMDKYKVGEDKAYEFVNAAIKHSDPVFPQAHHLLTIAGIESSFNEKAKSQLKHDPAIGATQIRPKVWNIHPSELSTLDGQFKHTAHILKTYHTKTGSIDAAIKSYNVGITNFNRGKQQGAAHRYFTKFNTELKRYD